jgi:hypothetical protein
LARLPGSPGGEGAPIGAGAEAFCHRQRDFVITLGNLEVAGDRISERRNPADFGDGDELSHGQEVFDEANLIESGILTAMV